MMKYAGKLCVLCSMMTMLSLLCWSMTSCACCAAHDVLRLLQQGAQNRHVASTKANQHSSRSHCVLTCTLESKCSEDGVTSIRTSCLRLVDLAGRCCAPGTHRCVRVCVHM